MKAAVPSWQRLTADERKQTATLFDGSADMQIAVEPLWKIIEVLFWVDTVHRSHTRRDTKLQYIFGAFWMVVLDLIVLRGCKRPERCKVLTFSVFYSRIHNILPARSTPEFRRHSPALNLVTPQPLKNTPLQCALPYSFYFYLHVVTQVFLLVEEHVDASFVHIVRTGGSTRACWISGLYGTGLDSFSFHLMRSWFHRGVCAWGHRPSGGFFAPWRILRNGTIV